MRVDAKIVDCRRQVLAFVGPEVLLELKVRAFHWPSVCVMRLQVFHCGLKACPRMSHGLRICPLSTDENEHSNLWERNHKSLV